MAIGNASVTRAQCDACPQVVYAEGNARPKGFTGHAQFVDGTGRETNAPWFACQAQHVGKAVQNAIKAAKSVPETPLAVAEPVTYQKPEESYS